MRHKPMTALQLARRIKGRRPKKPIRAQPPILLEKKYQKALRAYVGLIASKLREIVLPQLPAMVANAGFRRDAGDDSVAQKLLDLMRAVNISLEEAEDEEEIRRLVESISEEINGYNRLQVHRVFQSALGVDLLASEPALGEATAAFVGENVSLITSIKDQFLGEVEQAILRGIRSGMRHEEIANLILGESGDGFVSREGKAESRAKLIGRDQVNKFYGQLTELRQTAAGVEKYVWRTALDERVRPEHADREGEVFSWDDPPSGGHPGEDINCRCYAEPILDETPDEG
jgi:SPP1 gp7 family putative phage head morphogenesis protein